MPKEQCDSCPLSIYVDRPLFSTERRALLAVIEGSRDIIDSQDPSYIYDLIEATGLPSLDAANISQWPMHKDEAIARAAVTCYLHHNWHS